MRRVVHISDLHFGRARLDLIEPLLASVTVHAWDPASAAFAPLPASHYEKRGEWRLVDSIE